MVNDVLQGRRHQAFPKLTAPQLARLEAHGERIDTRAGDVLVQPGERHHRLMVVLAGSLEVALPGMRGEELVTILTPGEFAGEMSTLRGVAGFTRIRVRESGAVLAIDEESLRDVVQTDAELSEIFMRAFILRRMGLVAAGQGDVMLLGSRHSADTLRLREFLTRNTYPFVNIDIDSDPGVQALLERFNVAVDDVPVLIGRCGRVFKNPSNHDVAEFLQMNPTIEPSTVYDLLVVGAGPAGLAAAVYAASEGLSVLVVETTASGGQAGTSSKIENYLGFPTGISGQALAGRAFTQAQKFGANVTVACQAHAPGLRAPALLGRALRRPRRAREHRRHRHRRAGTGSSRWRICRASSARASTTPPRIWRPSSARARTSWSSAAATRRARPRSSWPAAAARCTC